MAQNILPFGNVIGDSKLLGVYQHLDNLFGANGVGKKLQDDLVISQLSPALQDNLLTWWREDSAYQRMVKDMQKAGLNPWSGISSGGSASSRSTMAVDNAQRQLETARMFSSLVGDFGRAGIYGSAIGLARKGAISAVRSAEKMFSYQGKRLTMAEMLAQGAYEASRNL